MLLCVTRVVFGCLGCSFDAVHCGSNKCLDQKPKRKTKKTTAIFGLRVCLLPLVACYLKLNFPAHALYSMVGGLSPLTAKTYTRWQKYSIFVYPKIYPKNENKQQTEKTNKIPHTKIATRPHFLLLPPITPFPAPPAAA